MPEKDIGQIKYKSFQEVINTTIALAVSIVTGDGGGMITSLAPVLFALKSRFLKPFSDEYTQLLDKEKIDENYYDTEQCKTGIQEILDAIENDLLDENVFLGMKKIFLVAATEEHSSRNDILPLEYLRMCRKLEPGEILLLNANYRILKDKIWTYTGSIMGVSNWVSLIAENSELIYGDLILLHEKGLMDKQLLKGRAHSDRTGVGLDRNTFRLTDFGFALCEYIEHYDSLLNSE